MGIVMKFFQFAVSVSINIFGAALPILMPVIWGLDGILWSFPVADILTAAIAVVVILGTYRELN